MEMVLYVFPCARSSINFSLVSQSLTVPDPLDYVVRYRIIIVIQNEAIKVVIDMSYYPWLFYSIYLHSPVLM
jgi:hypothetical protein